MLFPSGVRLGWSRLVVTRAMLCLFHPVLRDGCEMFLCVRSPTVREGLIRRLALPHGRASDTRQRAQFLTAACDSTGRALS
jgi:hypothetical protein